MRPRTASLQAQASNTGKYYLKESSEASLTSSRAISPSSSTSSSLLQPGSSVASLVEKGDRDSKGKGQRQHQHQHQQQQQHQHQHQHQHQYQHQQAMTSESSLKAVGASKRTTRSRYMLLLVVIMGSLLYFILYLPSHEYWEPSGLKKFVGDGAETFTVTHSCILINILIYTLVHILIQILIHILILTNLHSYLFTYYLCMLIHAFSLIHIYMHIHKYI